MNEQFTRNIELGTQDWELLRGAITREIRRWPPGHLNHFRLVALLAQISNCCVKRSRYKNIK
jgi:hypothetical protein